MNDVWLDSWETIAGGPLFEDFPTLEDEIARGDTWERQHYPWTTRIGVRNCPGLLLATLDHLVGKHPRLTTRPAVTRYVSRCGTRILKELWPLRVLKEKRTEAYNDEDELRLQKFRRGLYDFGTRLGVTTGYLNAHVYLWVDAEISNWTSLTGLSGSTLVLVTFIFGLVQDAREWIPENYFRRFRSEVEQFAIWLLQRANEL